MGKKKNTHTHTVVVAHVDRGLFIAYGGVRGSERLRTPGLNCSTGRQAQQSHLPSILHDCGMHWACLFSAPQSNLSTACLCQAPNSPVLTSLQTQTVVPGAAEFSEPLLAQFHPVKDSWVHLSSHFQYGSLAPGHCTRLHIPDSTTHEILPRGGSDS